MSVHVSTRVWKAIFPTLAFKIVALKLADCSNDEGENIYPSVERVRMETGASLASIRSVLADMEASGLLDVIKEGHGRRKGKSTTVRGFNLETLEEIIAGRLAWKMVDVPVVSGKNANTGKSRKAWRLTPPNFGGVENKRPLQPLEPTPPTIGALYNIDEPSVNRQCSGRAEAHPKQDAPKKQPPEKQKRITGTRLPADWTLPDEWRDWARREFPRLNAQAEADKFGDHWKAACGSRATKLDWFATWRNWCRGARQVGLTAPRHASHDTPSPFQIELARRLAAEGHTP